MKALLFPGADAIEDINLRVKAMKIPSVVDKLNEAENFFHSSGITLELSNFMEQDNKPLASWFHRCAVATLAVQVGLYSEYVKTYGEPDVYLGCSLGDVARNVCLGACTFEDALPIMHQFAVAVTNVSGGAIFRVTTPFPFSADDAREFEAYKVEVCMYQTPHHILVAGLVPDLNRWIQEYAIAKGYKAKPLYPFPLHTRHMQSCVHAIEKSIESGAAKPWSKKAFSALSCSWISDIAQLKKDILTNVTQVVRWTQSLEILHTKWGVNEFINLGPSTTLINFHEQTFNNKSVKITNFFEELISRQ